MNPETPLIEIEVDESSLAGWVTSDGPGGTARFVNTLDAARADRETRGFTLLAFVDALNDAAEATGLPLEFIAHTSTYNGARRPGEEARDWEDAVAELMADVEERLRAAVP